MAKYEIRFNTRVGELSISFDTLDELKESLKVLDLKNVGEEISRNLGKLPPIQVRQPKPGLEWLYRFTPEGYVELFVKPAQKVETIAVTLFAHDPVPASPVEVALSSGVKDVMVYFRQPRYKKYFIKNTDGTISLSHEGKSWVLKNILPKLKPKQPILAAE